MSKTRTHGTGMSFQNQHQLGKLQALVDLGVSAGLSLHAMTPMTFPTKPLSNTTNHRMSMNVDTSQEHQETPVPQEHPEHPETPSTPAEEPRTPQKLSIKISQVKLGYLGIHEKPEELRPPVVDGIINGHVARIMLDSGCSTYVLSTDFTRDRNIPVYSCKPIPVELAVRNAGQFSLDTQTKK